MAPFWILGGGISPRFVQTEYAFFTIKNVLLLNYQLYLPFLTLFFSCRDQTQDGRSDESVFKARFRSLDLDFATPTRMHFSFGVVSIPKKKSENLLTEAVFRGPDKEITQRVCPVHMKGKFNKRLV